MTVKVENFGCRLNALEGDSVKALAEAAGLSDTTIINGCAVTNEAMRQAGQAARKAKRAAPNDQVIVTGCAAQTDAPRFQAMQEARLMPHLHLSLQAGDNMILKRMKRRHNREQAIAFCHKLRDARPDIAYGADLIAGFPTETEAMFENSVKLVAECDLSWLHVFPYSPRPGTPAARMPQIDGAQIKQRAARLRAAGDTQRGRWLERQLGRTLNVLIEKTDRDGAYGRAEDFARMRIDAGPEFKLADLQPGRVVQVKAEAHDGLMLSGAIPANKNFGGTL